MSIKHCMYCNKEENKSPEEEERYGERFLSYVCLDCYYKKENSKLPLIYRDVEDKYNFKEYIENLNESLFLYGDSGSGKTFLSAMILKMIWKESGSGKFISYPEFIYSIQTDYENNAGTVDDIKKYQYCLVIDDFGAEKMTDFVRQISYLIINYREQNKLQTIITSNFTLDEIDKFVDRRVSSRIGGMCKIIKMTGDKRIKK